MKNTLREADSGPLIERRLHMRESTGGTNRVQIIHKPAPTSVREQMKLIRVPERREEGSGRLLTRNTQHHLSNSVMNRYAYLPAAGGILERSEDLLSAQGQPCEAKWIGLRFTVQMDSDPNVACQQPWSFFCFFFFKVKSRNILQRPSR